MSAAQEYLQALRECVLPPPDLREAWDAFYRACDPFVRQTVAACRIRSSDADDCVQEAWSEISMKLTLFEYDPARGPVEGWLRIVVRRAACRHDRRDRRHSASRIDEDLAAVTCERILGPATTSQRQELRASVRDALRAFRTSVSNTAFQILLMVTVQGRTSTEIGKLLTLSPGCVRVSYHRTAKKFREFIAAQPGLAETLGVSALPNTSAEINRNQHSFRVKKAR